MIKSILSFISICGFVLLVSCQKNEELVVPVAETETETEVEEETEEEQDPETETSNILSEVSLEANVAGNTYELINAVLAPGYDVIEAPDCSHEDFGRHIDETYDADLDKNVFRFFIHATPDNDRCINFDRQRNEIKTYDKSPDELKGVSGEKVIYSWKFKLSEDFQSSSKFTHIHQIKAVGGTESSMPLITLTTRKGTPDHLELRYSETTSQITLTEVELAPFKGVWVEAVETVIYGEDGVGNYQIEIKTVATETTLLSYSNSTIRMWKTEADFMRPKWGIYRSLVYVEDLKDEEVLFSDFNIKEIEN